LPASVQFVNDLLCYSVLSLNLKMFVCFCLMVCASLRTDTDSLPVMSSRSPVIEFTCDELTCDELT